MFLLGQRYSRFWISLSVTAAELHLLVRDEQRDCNLMRRIWAAKQALHVLLHKIYRPITDNISFLKLQMYDLNFWLSL
jgi:hypothetical protein